MHRNWYVPSDKQPPKSVINNQNNIRNGKNRLEQRQNKQTTADGKPRLTTTVTGAG